MKKLFMRLLRLAIPLAAVFALSNLYATEIFKAIQQGDLEKLQQVIPPGGVDTVTSHLFIADLQKILPQLVYLL